MRKWLMLVIAIRKRLIINGTNKKNVLLMTCYIRNTESWLQAYPNATDQQILRFFNRHHNNIYELLPGSQSSCFKKFQEQFNSYLQLSYNA